VEDPLLSLYFGGCGSLSKSKLATKRDDIHIRHKAQVFRFDHSSARLIGMSVMSIRSSVTCGELRTIEPGVKLLSGRENLLRMSIGGFLQGLGRRIGHRLDLTSATCASLMHLHLPKPVTTQLADWSITLLLAQLVCLIQSGLRSISNIRSVFEIVLTNVPDADYNPK
jgi:hypothetical protein